MADTNALLGYPPEVRLLIINADDFGLCHSINEAIFQALTEGVVSSTTLMMPCPWAGHALHLLKEHPELSFGVHLTAICDTTRYKFGPLAPKEKVPSLVDETGYFYSFERMSEFITQVRLPELELEFRTQIETALTTELRPTHLDWHCLRFESRPEIFDLMFGLAREYGLALRVVGQYAMERVRGLGLPANGHDFLDSFRLERQGKSEKFAHLLRSLPAGLSEWAVHPGLDTAELQAIQPSGAWVRQTDLDFLISEIAKALIEEEGIVLLSYEPLQALWR